MKFEEFTPNFYQLHLEEKRELSFRKIPQTIDAINTQESKLFNEELGKLEQIMNEFYQKYFDKNGAISCGENYENYSNIREKIRSVHDKHDKSTVYSKVLYFVLIPLLDLPPLGNVKILDTTCSDKMVSKQRLNIAIMLSTRRLSFVQGYWVKQQLSFS